MASAAAVEAALAERAQRQIIASSVGAALRECLHAAQEADLTAQLETSIAAPGVWEPKDWRWRPTWVAEAALPPARERCTPAERSAPAALSTQQQQRSPAGSGGGDAGVGALLAAYCAAAAELAAPAELQSVLQDGARLDAYGRAIRDACADRLGGPAGARVLCLGPGAPVWALLAACAGASAATAVLPSPLAFQAARAFVEANRQVVAACGGDARAVHLAPVPLRQCRAAPVTPAAEADTADGSGQGQPPLYALPGGPVHLVVTDQLDPTCVRGDGRPTPRDPPCCPRGSQGAVPPLLLHRYAAPVARRALGKGLVADLHLAASAGLVAPGARCLPGEVRLMGRLVQQWHTGVVAGLDLSPVNKACGWYTQPRPTAVGG